MFSFTCWKVTSHSPQKWEATWGEPQSLWDCYWGLAPILSPVTVPQATTRCDSPKIASYSFLYLFYSCSGVPLIFFSRSLCTCKTHFIRSISKHREDSWKYDAQLSIFWRNLRCLEMWWNTVFSVDISSQSIQKLMSKRRHIGQQRRSWRLLGILGARPRELPRTEKLGVILASRSNVLVVFRNWNLSSML